MIEMKIMIQISAMSAIMIMIRTVTMNVMIAKLIKILIHTKFFVF